MLDNVGDTTLELLVGGYRLAWYRGSARAEMADRCGFILHRTAVSACSPSLRTPPSCRLRWPCPASPRGTSLQKIAGSAGGDLVWSCRAATKTSGFQRAKSQARSRPGP